MGTYSHNFKMIFFITSLIVSCRVQQLMDSHHPSSFLFNTFNYSPLTFHDDIVKISRNDNRGGGVIPHLNHYLQDPS